MKRDTTPKAKQPLVLKRDVVRVLDDDALRQIQGGSKGGSSTKMMMPNQNA